MNDHDAMEAINAVIDEFGRVELTAFDALLRVARISGANAFAHAEAKKARA